MTPQRPAPFSRRHAALQADRATGLTSNKRQTVQSSRPIEDADSVIPPPRPQTEAGAGTALSLSRWPPCWASRVAAVPLRPPPRCGGRGACLARCRTCCCFGVAPLGLPPRLVSAGRRRRRAGSPWGLLAGVEQGRPRGLERRVQEALVWREALGGPRLCGGCLCPQSRLGKAWVRPHPCTHADVTLGQSLSGRLASTTGLLQELSRGDAACVIRSSGGFPRPAVIFRVPFSR